MNSYEADALPEIAPFQDAGCEFAPSCLNCPLPLCIYDEPGGRQKLRKQRRDREIVRLFTREGKTVPELAQSFGVSPRTVQRALKAGIPVTKKERDDGRSLQTG